MQFTICLAILTSVSYMGVNVKAKWLIVYHIAPVFRWFWAGKSVEVFKTHEF